MPYRISEVKKLVKQHLFKDKPEPAYFDGFKLFECQFGWILSVKIKESITNTPIGLGWIIFEKESGSIKTFGSGSDASQAIVLHATSGKNWQLTLKNKDQLKVLAKALIKITGEAPSTCLRLAREDVICVADWHTCDCLRIVLSQLGVDSVLGETLLEKQGLTSNFPNQIEQLLFHYQFPRLFNSSLDTFNHFDPEDSMGSVSTSA